MTDKPSPSSLAIGYIRAGLEALERAKKLAASDQDSSRAMCSKAIVEIKKARQQLRKQIEQNNGQP